MQTLSLFRQCTDVCRMRPIRDLWTLAIWLLQCAVLRALSYEPFQGSERIVLYPECFSTFRMPQTSVQHTARSTRTFGCGPDYLHLPLLSATTSPLNAASCTGPDIESIPVSIISQPSRSRFSWRSLAPCGLQLVRTQRLWTTSFSMRPTWFRHPGIEPLFSSTVPPSSSR